MTGLGFALSLTASTPASIKQHELQAIFESYGSTDSEVCGPRSIDSEIDSAVLDDDNYEEDEPRPSDAAVQELKDLIGGVENAGVEVPVPTITTYYGEVDATWRSHNRTLRLVSYSDGKPPLLYFQADNREALTRGETICPATIEALQDKLQWLRG